LMDHFWSRWETGNFIAHSWTSTRQQSLPLFIFIMTTYHIIYPRGDRSKIDVIQCSDHEILEYDVASRHTYYDFKHAYEYAKSLAQKHGKELVTKLRNEYLD
jgi:hypothetical protein